MEGNPCSDFFSAHSGERDMVKQLIAANTGSAWSTLNASEHSPGLVGDQENLVRNITQPHHWDRELSWIKLGFYDDLAGIGLSVNRLAYKSMSDVIEAGLAKEREHPTRVYIGVLQFGAGEICDLVREVPGADAAVFDTALPEDISHADVCQISGAKSVQKAVREWLYQKFKDRVHQA